MAKSDKISNKFNAKTVDPFKEKNLSSFAQLYNSGQIPCRLDHGSVRHKLTWTRPMENENYEFLLVAFAEGLKETTHPYNFICQQGFQDMMCAHGAYEKIIPTIPRIIPLLRMNLNHKEASVFKASLSSLSHLSTIIGPLLNAHLKVLLPPIAKKLVGSKNDDIIGVLQTFEQYGGKEASLAIKNKIPTYSSVI